MKKTFLKTKKATCKVTFELPGEISAEKAFLVGEFNQWEPQPMKRKRDGSFSAVLNLETGKEYRFRYWLDQERWENDWQADRYVPNEFGTEDSVVITSP